MLEGGGGGVLHIFKHTKPPVGGGKSLNEWVNWFVQNAESFSKQNTVAWRMCRSVFGTIFIGEIEQNSKYCV